MRQERVRSTVGLCVEKHGSKTWKIVVEGVRRRRGRRECEEEEKGNKRRKRRRRRRRRRKRRSLPRS